MKKDYLKIPQQIYYMQSKYLLCKIYKFYYLLNNNFSVEVWCYLLTIKGEIKRAFDTFLNSTNEYIKVIIYLVYFKKC